MSEIPSLYPSLRFKLDTQRRGYAITLSSGEGDIVKAALALLRETTHTAMNPALKERIWQVIGDE